MDDPFWMSSEAFDAHLAEVNAQQAEQANRLGPDAPAAQNIRVASPSRAPLPSLDPRKKGPAVAELPEAVRRAVEIIATPHASEDQTIGSAAYLLKWYQTEYQRRPTLKGMVGWWWRAARRRVDIRGLWVDETRLIWKTNERQDALDPACAPVNAFYGVLAHHAARVFITAQGHNPDQGAGRKLMRGAGFSSSNRPLKKVRNAQLSPRSSGPDATRFHQLNERSRKVTRIGVEIDFAGVFQQPAKGVKRCGVAMSLR
ncbi:hypothetical protein E4Z66_19420 [Aliishimia ponticola]|uniref:Uncharacterized protein n=1 Tax=Aliishimia ponticola TaxID=2499833 RepID=A0A4V3XJS2_9RHOB|nr:hypothetical protein E4Z66_19420 [Aliishimia ponticola]